MPQIDLDRSFNLLELEKSKRLKDLCFGVRDAPWKELHPDEIHVLLNTLRYLKVLCERGLVEDTTPLDEQRYPANIPGFMFRRLRVEHEEKIREALDGAKYSLRAQGLGMRDRGMLRAS